MQVLMPYQMLVRGTPSFSFFPRPSLLASCPPLNRIFIITVVRDRDRPPDRGRGSGDRGIVPGGMGGDRGGSGDRDRSGGSAIGGGSGDRDRSLASGGDKETR